jgi:hypothetical protein
VKVAIVTGASLGIGAGIAAGFRGAGYAVVANSRSIQPADEHDLLTVPGDIAEAATAQLVVEQVSVTRPTARLLTFPAGPRTMPSRLRLDPRTLSTVRSACGTKHVATIHQNLVGRTSMSSSHKPSGLGAEYVDCAGDDQEHGDSGDRGFKAHHRFRAQGERQRVGWAESNRVRQQDVEVVPDLWTPRFA